MDDDPDTLQVVTLILRKQGVNVLQAANAQEARNVLRDLIPDALISDIGMPEMNGYEFIRLIRNTDTPTRSVPALALTAFASNEVEVKVLEAGFDVYLAKPIESKKLLQALSQLLSSRLQS
ncbi:Transcriptional regulatory protein PhoP [compost metagenome]